MSQQVLCPVMQMMSASKQAPDPGLERALEVFLGPCRSTVEPQEPERVWADGSPLVHLSGPSHGKSVGKLPLGRFPNVQQFAVLPSTQSIRWLLPLGNTRCSMSGLQVYTPYSRRARFLKKLLLGVIKVGDIGWSRHRLLIAAPGPLPLQRLVFEVMGEREPVFALSLARPGSFRKLTIQVMRPEGEILGYIKLPLTETAVERVRHEALVLNRLWNSVALRPFIPELIYAGEWHPGYILVQSRGPSRPGPAEFGPLHERFLQTLWGVHRVQKPGSVLVKETTGLWQRTEASFDPELRGLGARALDKASRVLARLDIQCGIMHGDFAPWNTRIENGNLFLFDWESADWEVPISWDVFHFHVEMASLLNHKKDPSSFVRHPDPADRASFLLYLLRSVCQLVRGQGVRLQSEIECRRRLLINELS